jgi:hypothetical protein
LAEIAVRENITDNYVGNLIHLAWLSPDLVCRVLDGEPEATTLARGDMLTRKSDVLWGTEKPEKRRGGLLSAQAPLILTCRKHNFAG